MKQEYFRDCYKILNLRGRKFITDEMVFNSYNNLKEQLTVLKRKSKTEEELKLLQEIEILINDAYRMLQTEEKRKKYDDFLVEVEKIKEKKTEPKMTLEEYEQKKKEHEQIQKRMQERVRNFMKETQSKRLNEDGIKFTPIYKGEINRTPKKDREEDEAR